MYFPSYFFQVYAQEHTPHLGGTINKQLPKRDISIFK